MIYEVNLTAVVLFSAIVGLTLWLSVYLAKSATSASGFFAAGGGIHWFVNGVAFAGDYLSAASFLGICGMIAFYGYDGFLYSIGYLAGWIVALLVIAEPLKRRGKYTFADALDATFQSRGIRLSASISTLVVSVFYLIPQMVGAGVLVQPLFGLDHWVGVTMVGAVVVAIVMTAGMVSTTYVQFLKGGLLVFFSFIITILILNRGFTVLPEESRAERLADQVVERGEQGVLINGLPQGRGEGEAELRTVGEVLRLPNGQTESGPLGPLEFFQVLQESEIALWRSKKDGNRTIYSAVPTSGKEILRPGNHPNLRGMRSEKFLDRLNFVSLMLALFCGTAALPHILIRYYTVKDQVSARKSTIVGIGTIGLFYILTLYLGLGAMTSRALDVTDSNMAAPLLARSFSNLLFAVLSAVAFTTVLGTVSGLIIAASGAVAHDLVQIVTGRQLEDQAKIRVAKGAAFVVGILAIILGIAFQKMNVNFLVGWAFSVAASANLPALVLALFWKRATREGITASILVGMFSSLTWILLSGDTYVNVYGWPAEDSFIPFSQPGIVTIPLSFLTLVAVSLATPPRAKAD
jgi:cation/acetate symporter